MDWHEIRVTDEFARDNAHKLMRLRSGRFSLHNEDIVFFDGTESEREAVQTFLDSPGDKDDLQALKEALGIQDTLENTSFVVLNGTRYDLAGNEEPFDLTKPHDASELYGDFDIEYCGVDKNKKPLVYIFTHTQQEWEKALQATKHLRKLGRLSPESYIEFNNQKIVSVGNPLAVRTGKSWVSIIRESMYRIQNDIPDDL